MNNYIILGVLAVLFVAVNFVPKTFYTSILSLFKKKNVDVIKDLPVKQVGVSHQIHEIVEQWSILKGMLKDENLNEAVKTLDEVFLKLLKKNGEAQNEKSS